MESFKHAGGFLAARHTQVQPLFVLLEQRIRIIVTIIAALPAVLLRHRRHQAPLQRPPFGKLHAVSKRHGGIVPRRAIVGLCVAICSNRRSSLAGKVGQEFRDVGGGKRSDTVLQPEQPGEQTVEPSALLRRERRRFRE